MKKLHKYTFALIIAAALVVSAAIISRPEISISCSKDNIAVTGHAEKSITALAAYLNFNVSATSKDIAGGYEAMVTATDKMLKLLSHAGFAPDEVEFFNVEFTPVYAVMSNGLRNNQVEFYRFSRDFRIRSKNIDLVEYNSQLPQQLLADGLEVRVLGVFYENPDERAVTDQLIAEASADAANKASKIAAAAGLRAGKLLKARCPETWISGTGRERTACAEVTMEFEAVSPR